MSDQAFRWFRLPVFELSQLTPHGVEMSCSLLGQAKFQLQELIKWLLLSSAPKFGVVWYAAEDFLKSLHPLPQPALPSVQQSRGQSKASPTLSFCVQDKNALPTCCEFRFGHMIDYSQRKWSVPILGRSLKSPVPSAKFLSPVTVMVEVHTDTISQTPQWNYKEQGSITNQAESWWWQKAGLHCQPSTRETSLFVKPLRF